MTRTHVYRRWSLVVLAVGFGSLGCSPAAAPSGPAGVAAVGAPPAGGSGAAGTPGAGVGGAAGAGVGGVTGVAGGSGASAAGGLGGMAGLVGTAGVGPTTAGAGGTVGGGAGFAGAAGVGPIPAGAGGAGGGAGLAGWGGIGGAPLPPVDATPGARRVNQLFIRHGLQLGAWVGSEDITAMYYAQYIVDPRDWERSGFTGPTVFQPPGWLPMLLSAFPSSQWSLAQLPEYDKLRRGPTATERSQGFLTPEQTAHLDRLTVILFGDEEDHSPSLVTHLQGWFEVSRKHYPNVLVHNNQWGRQWTDQQLRSYIRQAKPDLITFDDYPFRHRQPASFRGSKRLGEFLVRYRNLALEGIDGNGAQPIQFGHFTQGFRRHAMEGCTLNDYILKESQLRLYYYLTWTLGGRWQGWFRWMQGNHRNGVPGTHGCDLLLQNGVPNMPTEVMGWTGELNRESIRLSPYLVRIQTTGVGFVAGDSGATDGQPNGMPRWAPGMDLHLKAVRGRLLGPEQNGKQGDLFVGYYRVIPAAEGGDPKFFKDPDARFFMVMNAFTSKSLKTAHETRQRVTLELELGGAQPRFLKEIDRGTGQIRMAPVTAMGGGRFQLTTEIPGGTGTLYMVTTAAD